MDKVEKIMERWNSLLPLSERDRELLSRRFTIDFNYNSNHIEGNTLTYGQTEILLLFGKVIGEAEVRDVQEMTASNVGLKMMTEEAAVKDVPLTQNFMVHPRIALVSLLDIIIKAANSLSLWFPNHIGYERQLIISGLRSKGLLICQYRVQR